MNVLTHDCCRVEIALTNPSFPITDDSLGSLLAVTPPQVHIRMTVTNQGEPSVFEVFGRIIPGEKLLTDNARKPIDLLTLSNFFTETLHYESEMLRTLREVEKENISLRKELALLQKGDTPVIVENL